MNGNGFGNGSAASHGSEQESILLSNRLNSYQTGSSPSTSAVSEKTPLVHSGSATGTPNGIFGSPGLKSGHLSSTVDLLRDSGIFQDHPTSYKEHQSANAQYLRDAILGVNDGLVSMFLLTLGLAGGQSSAQQILLAGITGAVAGAISMALGEYIATKSQRQVTRSEIDLEREHLMYFKEKEMAEARAFLQELRFTGPLLEGILSHLSADDEAMIRFMCAFEFGFQEELERHPLKAMLTSGLLFTTGAIPACISYVFISDVMLAVQVSIVLVVIALFAVGALKTWNTKGAWIYEGFENLILGLLGGAVTFALGALYHHSAEP